MGMSLKMLVMVLRRTGNAHNGLYHSIAIHISTRLAGSSDKAMPPDIEPLLGTWC